MRDQGRSDGPILRLKNWMDGDPVGQPDQVSRKSSYLIRRLRGNLSSGIGEHGTMFYGRRSPWIWKPALPRARTNMSHPSTALSRFLVNHGNVIKHVMVARSNSLSLSLSLSPKTFSQDANDRDFPR
jgi:hypothetical protein